MNYLSDVTDIGCRKHRYFLIRKNKKVPSDWAPFWSFPLKEKSSSFLCISDQGSLALSSHKSVIKGFFTAPSTSHSKLDDTQRTCCLAVALSAGGPGTFLGVGNVGAIRDSFVTPIVRLDGTMALVSHNTCI